MSIPTPPPRRLSASKPSKNAAVTFVYVRTKSPCPRPTSRETSHRLRKSRPRGIAPSATPAGADRNLRSPKPAAENVGSHARVYRASHAAQNTVRQKFRKSGSIDQHARRRDAVILSLRTYRWLFVIHGRAVILRRVVLPVLLLFFAVVCASAIAYGTDPLWARTITAASS